jgi:hypothetical protein
MNSELLNRLPRLKKLNAVGWEKEGERRANVGDLRTLEKTCGQRASGLLIN